MAVSVASFSRAHQATRRPEAEANHDGRDVVVYRPGAAAGV